MGMDRIEGAALIAIVSLLLVGCIPVPFPTKATQPRYSEAQLASLVPGSTTRDAVQQTMGAPDVRRMGDRLWIYLWGVGSGKLLFISPVFVGYTGPLTGKDFQLFLEFDASGMLQSYSFAQPAKDSQDSRWCTAAGFCLEHPVNTGEVTSGGFLAYEFIDAWSAVTANGAAKASLGWPVPPAGECVSVLWPDTTWSKSGGFWGFTPLGLPVTVDGLAETQDPTWLPNGSFTVLVLPAGEHTLRAFSPQLDPYYLNGPHTFATETSTGAFQCRPGERVYLAIGTSTNKGNRFPIVLTRVDEAVALAQIAAMPRVVLP
jgi:outer membrane protein assembly factor BamE (lipoprotein component of BamABCDE complex)